MTPIEALKRIKEIVEQHTVRGAIVTSEVVDMLDVFLNSPEVSEMLQEAAS